MNAPQSIQSQVAALAQLTLGTKLEVGYFGGYITLPDGVYGIEVAPMATEFEGTWLDTYTEVPSAASYFDGLANTRAMAEAGSAIAKVALGTVIEGVSGWYIPARDELEPLYRGLKPTTETNYVYRNGENPSSLPVGYPYTEDSPSRTSVEAFQEGALQAFESAGYWSSTQYSRNDAWMQNFVDGCQFNGAKSNARRVRLVRRFKA